MFLIYIQNDIWTNHDQEQTAVIEIQLLNLNLTKKLFYENRELVRTDHLLNNESAAQSIKKIITCVESSHQKFNVLSLAFLKSMQISILS